MNRYSKIFSEEAVPFTQATELCLCIAKKSGEKTFVLYNPTGTTADSTPRDIIDILAYGVISFHTTGKIVPEDTWEVIGTAAEQGYGPLLYDIMLSVVKKEGLVPDRNSLSPAARRVWEFYYNKRKKEIVSIPIDNYKKPETPDLSDDGKVWEPSVGIEDRAPVDHKYVLKRPLPYQVLVDNYKQHASEIEGLGGMQKRTFFSTLLNQGQAYFSVKL